MKTHLLWLHDLPNQGEYGESIVKAVASIFGDYKMALGWLWETAMVF